MMENKDAGPVGFDLGRVAEAGRDWPGPRTQLVWWFPEWCGLGFFQWDGASACMFRWSILLGFVELRRWRPWEESWRLFQHKGRADLKEEAVLRFGLAVELRERRNGNRPNPVAIKDPHHDQ